MKLIRKIRSLLTSASVQDAGADPILCREPQADRETYLRLHAEACAVASPAMDALEAEYGFVIDRDWMNDLALHTQVVAKQSRINFHHGRLLYAVLRRYLADRQPRRLTIFETGTARGFSSLCMARAMRDAGVIGTILTVDMLPHEVPMYWNCIDDHDGQKSRRKLLEPWQDLCEAVVWIKADTRDGLRRLGMPPIGFAFLDASHTFEDVMAEFNAVSARQTTGDVIVFDDVTPELFPGVVQAVEHIAATKQYDVRRLRVDDQRGYAIATRR